MKAIFTPAVGSPVTLCDNSAGRGPTEKLFEGWWPRGMTQVVQNEPQVDSTTRFINALGNYGCQSLLRFSQAFATEGECLAGLVGLQSSISGKGTLEITYANGLVVTVTDAAYESISPVDIAGVRFVCEVTWQGSLLSAEIPT